jgi:hypothetical protein
MAYSASPASSMLAVLLASTGVVSTTDSAHTCPCHINTQLFDFQSPNTDVSFATIFSKSRPFLGFAPSTLKRLGQDSLFFVHLFLHPHPNHSIFCLTAAICPHLSQESTAAHPTCGVRESRQPFLGMVHHWRVARCASASLCLRSSPLPSQLFLIIAPPTVFGPDVLPRMIAICAYTHPYQRPPPRFKHSTQLRRMLVACDLEAFEESCSLLKALVLFSARVL